MKTIYLAGGCFWGVEKYLSLIPGVVHTETGYANGLTEHPSYEDVRHHGSGHAETVAVDYDPKKLELSRLLELFFGVIDPTSLNRQGEDEGVQYRTGIYYLDDWDRKTIDDAVSRLESSAGGPVVTEVKRLENYYPAEEYHQNYLDKHPQGYCHIGTDKFDALKQALAVRNVVEI